MGGAFHPLVEVLRRDCGLQPAALSKFEAGLLAAGCACHPARAGTVSFDSNPSVGELAFAVLRRHFAAVLAHETGTRLGRTSRNCTTCGWPPVGRGPRSLFSRSPAVRSATCGWSSGGWPAPSVRYVTSMSSSSASKVDPRRPRRRGDGTRRPGQVARPPAGRSSTCPAHLPRFGPLRAPGGRLHHHAPPGPSRRSAAARAPAAAVVPGLVEARHRSAAKAARRARRSGEGRTSTSHASASSACATRSNSCRRSMTADGQVPAPRGEAPGRLGLMQDARVAATRCRSWPRPRLDPLHHDGS